MFLLFQLREKKSARVQADDPISFLQLLSKNELGATEVSLQETAEMQLLFLFLTVDYVSRIYHLFLHKSSVIVICSKRKFFIEIEELA